MNKLVRPLVSVLVVASLAAMVWLGHGRRGPAPNVVLVVGCTVRADQTTPYGGGPDVTPHLASLARDGARLAWTVSQAPWTRPAMTALLTGRHPAEVGMADLDDEPDDQVLPERFLTLAERFREAGWHTVGGTANPNVNATWGLARGFEKYVEARSTSADRKSWRIRGTEMVRRVLEAVDGADRSDRQPLYVQVVLIDAHKPVDVEPGLVDAFEEPALPRRIAAYRAQLHRMDEAVRALDEGLAVRGLTPENTLFVFAADHGEGLSWPGPHHGTAHGRHLYPSVVRIPALLRGPGITPGTVVEGLSAQIDLPQTMLSLAGLPGIDGGGVDLSANLARGGATSTREVFTATWFDDAHRAAVYTSDGMCQLDGGHRRLGVSRPDFPTGCFDAATDPTYEEAYPDAERTTAVYAWLIEQEKAQRALAAEVRRAEPTPGEEEMLRELGYVE